MKKIIGILFLICVFSSCIKDENKNFETISKKESQVLEEKLNLTNPAFFRFGDVYFLDKNGYIHKNNLNDIKQWYTLGYITHYKSLADYIYVIFNQKLGSTDSITIKSMDICCKIDSGILELYRKEKIKGIMDKYCTYDNIYKCYKINRYVSGCELEAISYFFFINRYTKAESDKVFFIGFYPFSNVFGK